MAMALENGIAAKKPWNPGKKTRANCVVMYNINVFQFQLVQAGEDDNRDFGKIFTSYGRQLHEMDAFILKSLAELWCFHAVYKNIVAGTGQLFPQLNRIGFNSTNHVNAFDGDEDNFHFASS